MKAFTLTVRLPADMAEKAEELDRRDGNFWSRIVHLAVMRASIYEQIHHGREAMENEVGRIVSS